MPTYDYVCDACGNRFDMWQMFSADPITTCPRCQGHVRRIIHPVGLVFKGSGFYITDTRGKGTVVEPAAAQSDAAGANGATSAANGAKGAARAAADAPTSAPAGAAKPAAGPKTSSAKSMRTAAADSSGS